MDNLMKLLGHDKGATDPKAPIEPGEGLNEDINAKGEDGDLPEGFKAAASEAMDAVSSGDVDAFCEALKSCIDMNQ